MDTSVFDAPGLTAFDFAPPDFISSALGSLGWAALALAPFDFVPSAVGSVVSKTTLFFYV